MFQIGTQVIRKTDVRDAVVIVGEVIRIEAKRVRVHWNVSQNGGRSAGGHSSTLAATSLVEATDTLIQDVRARNRARHERLAAERDARRTYLCVNINPTACVMNDGHPSPLPLEPAGVKDGKCYYCGHPVVDRATWEREHQ